MAEAALAISVISAIGGAVAQRKASKAQRKQNRIQNRLAAQKRTRDTKRAIASRRVRVAELESAGFQLGVSGGTAVAGATAGVVGDVASTIGASNRQFTGAQFVADLQTDISGFQQTAQTFGSIGQVAGQFGFGETGAQNRAAIANLVGF